MKLAWTIYTRRIKKPLILRIGRMYKSWNPEDIAQESLFWILAPSLYWGLGFGILLYGSQVTAMKTRGFIPIVICLIVVAVAALLWMNERTAVRGLRIAVGPRVGSTYILGEAISEVVENADPRIDIVLVETKGAQDNVEAIKTERADLAIAPLDLGVNRDIRTVTLLYSDVFHFAVRRGSRINRVEDVKGKRVLIPPRGTESSRDFHVLLRHYGLSDDDIKGQEIKSLQWKSTSERDLEQMGIGAIFASAPLGEPLICKLLEGGNWQLLPIDQEAAMRIAAPYIRPYTIPLGTYRGADPAVPDRDIQTIGVQSALLVRAGVEAGMVRTITRIMFEHRSELIARTPLAAPMSVPDKDQVFGPAVHKGALAYYNREKPDLIKQYYNEICFFFMIGPMLLSVLMAVRARLQTKHLRRIDEYTRHIAELFMQIDSSTDLRGLIGLERELLKLFAQALKDLETGRLTTSDLHSLSTIWEKAIDAVHHRQVAQAKADKP